MTKPLIGITAGEARNLYHPNAPRMYGQQYTYVEAVERAGGVPVIIPIVSDEPVLRQLFDMCEGILLAGGNDINPELYQEGLSPRTKHLHYERDLQELKLAQWAVVEDKAVLAICRGMQMLNTAQGGTLYQDIPSDLPAADLHEIPDEKSHDREHQIVHLLEIESGCKLAEILGADRIGANAYHHQAIKQLGKGLVVTARTPDGVIEAVEMPDRRFMLGIQAHPEALEAEIEPEWRKLFAAFVTAARQ